MREPWRRIDNDRVDEILDHFERRLVVLDGLADAVLPPDGLAIDPEDLAGGIRELRRDWNGLRSELRSALPTPTT